MQATSPYSKSRLPLPGGERPGERELYFALPREEEERADVWSLGGTHELAAARWGSALIRALGLPARIIGSIVCTKRLHPMIIDTKAKYEAACTVSGTEPKHPSIAVLPHPFPHTLPELVGLGKQFSVLTRYNDPQAQSAAGVTEMLMYGLKGIAAYTDHSLMYNNESAGVYAFLHRALAFLAGERNLELADGLQLCLEAGKCNVESMSMLYDSNKLLGVGKPTLRPQRPRPGEVHSRLRPRSPPPQEAA
eukprot:Hpha_TRINITY_DN15735_c5_g1::TRINITY_DN15735_c5_g1_i12::g.42048::m.42048